MNKDVDISTRNALCVALFVGKGIVSPFIIEDIALALRKLKCSVELIPLNVTMEELSARLGQTEPDLIMALDGKGLDYAPVVESGIKRVAWFVDNPFYFRELKALHEDDMIFVWDEEYVADLLAAGFQHVHVLPLATNPDRFDPRPLTPQEKNMYGCDVSFVGTVGKPRDFYIKERERVYPKEVNSFVSKMVTLALQGYDERRYDDVLKGIRSVECAIDPAVRPLVQFLVDVEVNAIKRHELVMALIHYKSKIYGDVEQHMANVDQKCLCPPVDYRTKLAKVFKASTINVNITRPQLRTTVNQRIFDVFACGGFLLTDYRSLLNDILPFPPERICFAHIDELGSKIEYYLTHEEERREIIDAAQEAVLRRHTYVHRMEELLSIVCPRVQN